MQSAFLLPQSTITPKYKQSRTSTQRYATTWAKKKALLLKCGSRELATRRLLLDCCSTRSWWVILFYCSALGVAVCSIDSGCLTCLGPPTFGWQDPTRPACFISMVEKPNSSGCLRNAAGTISESKWTAAL